MKTQTGKALKREAFPSSTELIVASALLLLSTTTTPTNARNTLKRSTSWQSSYVKEENVFAKSMSVSSNTDRYCKLERAPDSRTRKFKAIETFVARYHEVKKMKVTRKKRTRTYWVSSSSEISSSCKPAENLVSPSGSGSTSAVSCLTNNSCLESSVQSNAGLGKMKSSPKRKVDKVIKGDTSNRIGSGHIRRRAEGILKMLATCDRASEVRIREVLGDSPDTSKALRMITLLSGNSDLGWGCHTNCQTCRGKICCLDGSYFMQSAKERTSKKTGRWRKG